METKMHSGTNTTGKMAADTETTDAVLPAEASESILTLLCPALCF